MNQLTPKHLAPGLALLLLLPACSWQDRMLPLRLQDQRSRADSPAVIDLYAVRGATELRRQTITPVDEYFDTLGRPSRPTNIRRIQLDAATPSLTLFPSADTTCRLWQKQGADTIIAVTPKPERLSTLSADPRRITFPLHSSRYPSGTHSLIITLTDTGLTLQPSRERLTHPKPTH